MINFILAVALSVLHLLAGKLRFITYIPRSIWLSVGGGISTAYVFLHLLPELAIAHTNWESGHIFLLSLAGLAFFYGMEKQAKTNTDQGHSKTQSFRLHTGSYAVYNMLVGYIVVAEYSGRELYLFTLAMACHFIVNDYSIRYHFPDRYDRSGRWVLGVAITAGALLAGITTLPETLLEGIVAFIGGGVILNVLKEELPEERKSNYLAFLSGNILFAVIILWIDTM